MRRSAGVIGTRIGPGWSKTSALAALVVFALLAAMLPAGAATISSAVFTGGAGTATVNGVLYAKSGADVTLTVHTTEARCVIVSGDHTGHQEDNSFRDKWTFPFKAAGGTGVKSVTVTAYEQRVTGQQPCRNKTDTETASYILDNAGPAVSASLAPAPNAAGWNKGPVQITWDATDAGAGFERKCDGPSSSHNPTPCTDAIGEATSGTTKTATAVDRVGNSASGSVTVKVDTTAPTITGAASPAANTHGWNNTDVTVGFACSDSGTVQSGIKSCPVGTTLGAEGANQSVTGKAVDVADNEAAAIVGNINIDKTAPVVTGAATTSPNAAGWYNGDVNVAWTCTETLSGLATGCPGDTTITGEGTDLGAASGSVSDKAGNSGSGSVGGIRIDRTAPNTTATAPDGWNNSDVTVSLNPFDSLSGVAATYFSLNGGSTQAGTSVSIDSEGVHTLEYWSVDEAGNVEAAKSVEVKIDKTKPSITHSQDPKANANGWNNTNVTVTFVCNDGGGSGIKSCTAPQTVTTEGKDQAVTGTAEDNAGNTATDPATVSIDKTAPTIAAALDRLANAFGWYNDDVRVSFTCGDALSGVSSCSAPVTLGEGGNQSAEGTATDAAANSKSETAGGINVDKTAPSLEGTALGTPSNGWYRDDVTVRWSCDDALSGIESGACPADTTVTGEGESLSASASVSDRAGNTNHEIVSGIRIDRTAPTTTAEVPEALASGWYAGGVEVTLSAVDHLSGADKTYYSVDGGPAQEYSRPFTHDLGGVHTITFWSADKAGNVEDAAAAGHSIEIKIDNIKPYFNSVTRLPEPNEFGWNNDSVTVVFDCEDDESGIAACSDAITLENEGEGQEAVGTAVDNAGNSASFTEKPVNIDKTPPTLEGVPTTNANAAGWYKGDVTIEWVATDGLSGVNPGTVPGNSVITGEGDGLGAGPVTVFDRAGNGRSASVSSIKIDRTAPVVEGAPTTSPNAAGWYRDPVTVAFSCTDNLSGVATCPSAKVVSTDGASQSVTSDGAYDVAGNEAAGVTVGGINVDGTAPTTEAEIVCTGKNGYCTGTSATVKLTSADQEALSGVKGIYYKVNAGDWEFAPGTSKDVTVPLTGSGTAKVLFYGEDNAGNYETQTGVDLEYDTIAPTVTHNLSPVPNALGWNNADVTVTFHAEDGSDGSGVDEDTLTKPVTVAGETAGRLVEGEAYDNAGNRGTDSVTVKLDKTAPEITGAATTPPNADGWYGGPVTVEFTCSDALSGIAVCPQPVTVTTSGADQSVEGTALDNAGNEASFEVAGLNVDAVKPEVTIKGIENGGIYILGAVPKASCEAADALSGLAAACDGTLAGGLANGVGTFTYTATAKDKGGNTATASVSYRVIYDFRGVTQPINDTGHNGGTISTFKAGSTVPVKFRLRKADGTVAEANTLPQWMTPKQGSLTMTQAEEAVVNEPPSSSFRWDPTDQQYIYNWGTSKSQGGYHWTLIFKLDDGQTYSVVVGLR